MTVELPAQQLNNKSKTNWGSIFQLVFSIMTLLVYLGLAVLLSLTRLDVSSEGSLWQVSPVTWEILRLALVTLGLLNLPSILSTGFNLAGRPQPGWLTSKMRWLNWSIVLFAVLLVIGTLLGDATNTHPTIQALLTVLGILLPAFWLLHFGSAHLWGTYPQRDFGMLTFSLGFSTLLILIIELVVLFLAMAGFGFMASGNPQIQQALQELMELIQGYSLDLEGATEVLESLLLNPTIMSTVLILVSGLIPLIEEAFKTLGVWFLVKHKVSPMEGYIAGLMSGAGFALVEGLLNATQVAGGSSTDWLAFLLGRFGGTLLHVFNGGLLGWALAKTWNDQKGWRVAGIYLLTVVFHGLWNAFALLGRISPILKKTGETLAVPMSAFSLFVMIALLLLAFILFTKKVSSIPAGSPASEWRVLEIDN